MISPNRLTEATSTSPDLIPMTLSTSTQPNNEMTVSGIVNAENSRLYCLALMFIPLVMMV